MKIEKYFILNKYILSLLGVRDFKDLQQKLKDVQEGIDSNGRSYFVNVLISSFPNRKISEEELLRYDSNIQKYVKRINYRRGNVTLKYFQYLAVLFTEIVLDRLKNRKFEFISELNQFLQDYEDEEIKEFLKSFTENDLKKLAFCMATGSGKTLIAHINYYQFFNYRLFFPDNILFITPNEGLSKQHYDELIKSGIPAKLYTGSLNSEIFKNANEVLIIEMTKFVEEKRGKGVTILIDIFEGENLVFVDEGHKGKKSEEQKWAKLRDKLTENGFVFEYSATFRQILNKKDEILKEYAKSIIFDYSYKYFYLDDYGKNFFVLNVGKLKVSEERFKDIMFVANLLSFYEQLLIYEEKKNKVKVYNIEKPLWIFVGTTVTGKKNAKKKKTDEIGEKEKILTDVVQIVKFIEKATKEEWLKNLVEDILEENTGIKDEEGKDIFKDKFAYFKKKGRIDFDDLYKKVFNGKGKFYIYELKNAEGEFGLKLSENTYFGVINIGDTSKFKQLLKTNVEKDVISNSLFESINKENSPINILIGSKKFIEGWDTWRVSSMGLLNIGRGEGPQIIQLFGRGVRLKGKDMSLKRSEDDSEIRCLETLNIYSINADYLKKFLETIKKEEIEFETIEIPIKLQHEDKWRELNILYKDSNEKFEEKQVLKLEYDDKIYFTIDLTPKISIYETYEAEERKILKVDKSKIKTEQTNFPDDKIELLNWKIIMLEIYEWKRLKRYWNLIIEENVIKGLLISDKFKLLLPENFFEVKTKDDVRRLEDLAILIIKKYIEKLYERKAKIFETSHITYKKLEDHKKQLLSAILYEDNPKYIIQIKKDKQEVIAKIKSLINNLEKLYKTESEELPRVYIDKHMFLPILIKSDKIDKILPEGLVESEKEFIIGIRDYFKNNKNKNFEVYILRNFSPSSLGFYLQWSKFYPDFIMWIKKNDIQAIVFVDPKGLSYTKTLEDEKIQFSKEIKELEKKLNNKNVILESFIISKTEYKDLVKGMVSYPQKNEYIENNVLFLQDRNWCEILFNSILEKIFKEN